MKIKYLLYTIATAILLLLASSCGSRKSVPSHMSDFSSATTPEAAFLSLAESYAPWTDVSLPVKVELLQPKHMSISGKATMVNDRSIYISLRFLGMEVGVIYADTDSVCIVSKFQRLAYAESMSTFSSRFGFSLADVQSLLLGRAFVPGSGSVVASDTKNFKISANPADPALWTMTPLHTPAGVKWHFEASMPDAAAALPAIVASLIVEPASMQPLRASFADAADTPAGIVASNVGIEAAMSGKEIAARLEWNTGKASWNTGVTVQAPKIQSGYTRITTAGLVNLLRKL